ncbi:Remorin family protein [Euphorbia peplus]|nr:Remorin family protein [Euphorbia peplus]
MDYLIKQSRRVKFSTQEDEERPVSSSKERRIQPQRTPSLREEKNRPQNWFGRQIPWQMNQAYDSNEVDKATAVAVATYVVISVTDSTVPDNKTLGGHPPKPSLTPVKSRKDALKVPSPQPAADISTIDNTKTPSLRKESFEIEEEKKPETAATVAVGPSPSVTRTPTIADKPVVKKVPTFAVPDDQLSTTKQIQPSESLKQKADPVPEIKTPKPDFPSAPKRALSPAKMDRQASPKTPGSTEADSWERAELAKIKRRYEIVEERVVSWENDKKSKSRRRLDKAESELERKRLKALEKFRSEIEDINQIVDGARSKAKERRRHDELKTKEKANTYRKTGQPPTTTTCFCF